MKFRFSISVKFAFLAILTVFSLSFAFTYMNYLDQITYFENNRLDQQTDVYGQVIDAYFGDFTCLNNDTRTNEIITDFMEKNPGFLSFNILLREEETNKLTIAESNDKTKIGTISPYVSKSHECLYEKDSPVSLTEKIGESSDYLFVKPIYSPEAGESGGYIGTCELILSMEDEFQLQKTRLNNFINMSIIFFVVILVALVLIVYKVINQPISILKKTATLFGKGNLDARVDIDSRDEFGELGSTLNKMADDLKKSRDKIEEYNKILERLLEQKDEFIGQLGHDLKNPLQPLVGLLPILIEQEKDPKTKETLEVMNQNVKYMKDLIFETLKLAKLRSDNISFDFEDINLKEETEGVIKSQKPMLKEKNIKIENNIDQNIVVQADKLRLAEVFKNLINNSVKYIPDSGGKITLDAENEEEEIKVIFTDTGMGMTKDQTKRIFDEFYKADKFTDDYYSTGLGLSICKRIVEKHGGKMWAESQGKGKGSTFYFTLKLKNLRNNEK